jgi:DNA topoisomerase-6 subunit A
MTVPLRTKDNLKISTDGVWKLGTHLGLRTAKKLDGALMLLRTMYLIDFIKDLIESKKSSTLRELYYISESWDAGKFFSDDESNKLVEDLEAISGRLRENFKLRPEESGASIMGNITIEELTRRGERKRINCRDDVGDSGYTIPSNVENEKIKFIDWDAEIVICIECGGMFDRLVENKFDEDYNAILVHLKGQPARSTKRLIKRLYEDCKIPIAVFTDGDPWSFRIYASIAYGAIKTAHISDYLVTPTAEFIGITPSDIINYELPSDKLNDRDIKALHAELRDPRFGDPWWQSELELMLELNKKAEQQSLAKYGLNYVTEIYLPEKLQQLGMI